MREPLRVQPLPDYPAEMGRWLWMMQEVRKRTLRLIDGMDQRTLDWEGADKRENAIGSLLYHIAYVEMGWLYFDIFGRSDLPEPISGHFPHPRADAGGRLSRVPGVPLAGHLDRLERSRETFLDAFREMSLDDWRQLRAPEEEDYEVTPEWAVFHLVEHEAGHAFQISSLKARAGRLFAARPVE